jgi:tetratricopeptide (TPR) repeat protein
VPVARPARSDPAKAAQLVTIGDRLFRAGNTKRAAERYEQAARAAPDLAAPRVRLAQVALVRGQFREAADYFREAVAAEPDWLAHARDIQGVYAEPADFHRQIAKLESRVLAEPGDRDAWLVLGAELYLSGQTRRAADVFLRLSDRRPDPALAAFLDATKPEDVEK